MQRQAMQPDLLSIDLLLRACTRARQWHVLPQLLSSSTVRGSVKENLSVAAGLRCFR